MSPALKSRIADRRLGGGAAGKPAYQAIAALAPIVGVYQEYPHGDKGKEVRRSWSSLSEQWVRGNLTSQEFLSAFEKEANAILAK
jgi:hypothetical protein